MGPTEKDTLLSGKAKLGKNYEIPVQAEQKTRRMLHPSLNLRITPPTHHPYAQKHPIFAFLPKKSASKFGTSEKSPTFALAIRGVAQPG